MNLLTSLHTFALKSRCSNVLTIKSVNGLHGILDNTLMNENYFVLGDGSNTIFVEDINIPILLNRIKGFEYTKHKDTHRLRVGAGENWHQLVTKCMLDGINGFENLALIPGSVGAAPIQNIGAYGVEVERFISKVEFYDTIKKDIGYFTREDCEFGYRDSVFKHQKHNHRIITHVHFELPTQYEFVTNYAPLDQLNHVTAQSIYNAVIDVRKEKLPDPAQFGNAGSFFKNPVITQSLFESIQKHHPNIPHYATDTKNIKVPAAWLIDTLGFKGKQYGNVACHHKQPLVLINLGDAKGGDLVAFAKIIKQSVIDNFGIYLENEVRIIGRQGLINI